MGAAVAAAAPPPTASRTSKHFPEPATPSKPPGEFTLAKSTTDDLDIQVREQRFPGAADVTLDTATAMRVGGNIVELAANSSGNLELWVDRKAVAYGSRALAGGGKISVDSPQLATVTWPDGTAVSVFSGNTIAIAHEVVTCNTRRRHQCDGQGGAVALWAPRGAAR